MATHTTHRMHTHSRKAFATLDAHGRREAIMELAYRARRPFTDREMAKGLHDKNVIPTTDANGARPRLTELLRAGKLREVGRIRDQETGRVVRLCWPVDRALPVGWQADQAKETKDD